MNPADPRDEGFLGGTPLGREFWRGHRGCGAAGARAFQLFCQQAAAAPPAQERVQERAQAHDARPAAVLAAGNTGVKKSPAGAVKAEVYLAVRNAVRSAHNLTM